MFVDYKDMPSNERRNVLIEAALKALADEGYTLNKLPGRGKSAIWEVSLGSTKQVAAIRTTQDRWIAFPPMEGGAKWKTLDDVEMVVIATVDNKDHPQEAHVHFVPAAVIREHFDRSYKARTAAGQTHRDNYGMWVNLDPTDDGSAQHAGAGIIQNYPMIARFQLDELIQGAGDRLADKLSASKASAPDEAAPLSISEVIEKAISDIARLASVEPHRVKIDLSIAYD